MKIKKSNTALHNTLDLDALRQKLLQEEFERITLSFYRYVIQEQVAELRNRLYLEWEELGVLGRIYLAREGINAQLSVPKHNFEKFKENLQKNYPEMPLKIAVEDHKESFLKLIVKVKNRILADGLDENSYDVTDVGKHLTAREFNEAMEKEGTIVVDIRNHYESEIGHFKNALLPDVENFREELPVVKEMLQGKEDAKILLYCTGGIRCEKTSAWLKSQGFQDVNQLHGGIIDYVRQVKAENLENKFIGKNFVFDGRLGERVSDEVLTHCHTCGVPADSHRNCTWQTCHVLFVQCETCAEHYNGCCSTECQDFTKLPVEEQKLLRKTMPAKGKNFMRRKVPVNT